MCNFSKQNQYNKIEIFSWNVRGLNTEKNFNGTIQKKYITLKYILKAYGYPKIVFLQETHLNKSENREIWEKEFCEYKCHFTYGGEQSRGTAVLIKKGIDFLENEVIHDTGGRATIVTGKLHGEVVSFASIYAHHGDGGGEGRRGFFESLVKENLPGINIIGGDFNSVVDNIKDRRSIYQINARGEIENINLRKRTANELINFVNNSGYVDPWRYHNPNEDKTFSWFEGGKIDRHQELTLFILQKEA